MSTPKQVSDLMDRVVAGGYCVGCGACASVAGSPLRMGLDDMGRLQPRVDADASSPDVDVRRVCPFADESENENDLARRHFGDGATFHRAVGYYRKCYAGHAVEPPYRERGTSGGLLTWALAELIQRDHIDAVIHIQPKARTADDDRMFAYAVSRDVQAVVSGAKSRYYPIEMSQVIPQVRQTPGRYAFVGIPCYVKAARLLARADPVIDQRIVCALSLVCGHLKTTRFAEFLAWQAGVKPDEMAAIDFRHKFPDRQATDYGVRVRPRDGGDDVIERVYGLYGTDWGMGFFKYEACDYCDDVLGETADASFGDAWLPEYFRDPGGTNVVVARSELMVNLFEGAAAEGRIHLESISADRVADSQAGGLRHRRQGLSYRLHLADRARRWRPTKRVPAKPWRLRPIFRAMYRARMKLAAVSHEAFAEARRAGSMDVFYQRMQPLVDGYHRILERRRRFQLVWLRRRVGRLRRMLRRARNKD